MIDFHFDTRTVKPHLKKLGILSLIVLLSVILLYFSHLGHYISLALTVFFVMCLNMLLEAFFGQLEYNPYSYNTIIYAGFSLFVVFIIVTCFYLSSVAINDPSVYDMKLVVDTLLHSARQYMIVTFPFILVFSLALCKSNVTLVKEEGFYSYNLLGFVLSFLLLAGEVIVFQYTKGKLSFLPAFVINVFCAVYLYFECMLIGTIIANLIVAFHEPAYDKDFVIIPGCGIDKEGKPYPLLQGRINRAIAFGEKQKAETGKTIRFIPSGGQGPDEVISEAQAMKNYLLEKGYRDEDVIVEDQSKNTYDNMLFSKRIIDEIDPSGKVIFSTSDFHVLRAGLKARRVKMKAQGIGARTIWYFWPNASVREFIGLLSQHRVKQGLILLGLIVIYTILTILF
jgi:vancomycin permeability regulator SanA